MTPQEQSELLINHLDVEVYQELFDYIHDNFNRFAIESEMKDIINIVVNKIDLENWKKTS